VKYLVLGFAFATACQPSSGQAISPQKTPAAVQPNVTTAWLKRYLSLHKAMVQMTPLQASQAAQILAGHNDCPPTICGEFANFPRDIAGQRKAFSRASEAAKVLWLGDKSLQQQVVLMHCPMVPGNWLQAPGKLLNPYAADTMLHCGYQVGADGKPKK
jgi:hypothetical protein